MSGHARMRSIPCHLSVVSKKLRVMLTLGRMNCLSGDEAHNTESGFPNHAMFWHAC